MPDQDDARKLLSEMAAQVADLITEISDRQPEVTASAGAGLAEVSYHLTQAGGTLCELREMIDAEGFEFWREEEEKANG